MTARRFLTAFRPPSRAAAAILLAALSLAAAPAPPAGAAEREKAKPVTFESASEFYAAQEWAKSAEAFEALVKAEPKNARAWYRLGASYANLKKYDQAVAAYRKGVEVGGNPIVMYNLACAFALGGSPDSALVWLGHAVDAGYRQPDAMESDADLASIRSDDRYRALLDKARRAASPCAFVPEARQFDFWIGTWDVRTATGDLAGTNEIKPGAAQCALVENWKSTSGGSGQSLNFYEGIANKWRQIWVDGSGVVTRFEGTFRDGSMRFEGERFEASGELTRVKMTFTPLPDGRIRQRGEASSDGGKTFVEEYDLYYSQARREG